MPRIDLANYKGVSPGHRDIDVAWIVAFQATSRQPVPHANGAPVNGFLSLWDYAVIREGWGRQPRNSRRVRRSCRTGYPHGLHGIALVISVLFEPLRESIVQSGDNPDELEARVCTGLSSKADLDLGGIPAVIFDTPGRIAQRVEVLREARVREVIITGNANYGEEGE